MNRFLLAERLKFITPPPTSNRVCIDLAVTHSCFGPIFKSDHTVGTSFIHCTTVQKTKEAVNSAMNIVLMN